MKADDTAQKTRAAVEAYVRAWATNDKDALLAAFAEDGVWVDPVGTPPNVGRDALDRAVEVEADEAARTVPTVDF